jgi:hypothetical protein
MNNRHIEIVKYKRDKNGKLRRNSKGKLIKVRGIRIRSKRHK